MKVAVVHDWLTGMRGGERVLSSILALYPEADIFTLLHVPGATSLQIDSRVKTCSFFQKLPWVHRYYRFLLPLYPIAIRQFDFSGYDLIISLSHAAAKNISPALGSKHICLCFTPMRYIWDQVGVYFGRMTPVLWPVISYLRRWDQKGAGTVDRFVAISNFIAARIRCFYKREATVIYPPVDTTWIEEALGDTDFPKGDFFLYAGALVPYKRADLVIKAFNQLGLPLVVAGRGPDLAKLKKMAGENVRFVGYLPDQELARLYARARALIFPAKEDFGLVPIEALAAGCPVIGLYDGAIRETIKGVKPWELKPLAPEQSTGVFIKAEHDEPSKLAALIASLGFFIANEDRFSSAVCREHASAFSLEIFKQKWQKCVADVLSSSEYKSGRGHGLMGHEQIDHEQREQQNVERKTAAL